jgi:hypothetical protein
MAVASLSSLLLCIRERYASSHLLCTRERYASSSLLALLGPRSRCSVRDFRDTP